MKAREHGQALVARLYNESTIQSLTTALAIAIPSDKTQILYERGQIHAADENKALAKQDYHRCLQLNPNFEGAHESLAEMYSLERDFEKARIHFLRVEEIQGKANYERYHELGFLHYCCGDYKQAIYYYDLAIDVCPLESIESQGMFTTFCRGVAYYGLGQMAHAMRDCNDAANSGVVTLMDEDHLREFYTNVPAIVYEQLTSCFTVTSRLKMYYLSQHPSADVKTMVMDRIKRFIAAEKPEDKSMIRFLKELSKPLHHVTSDEIRIQTFVTQIQHLLQRKPGNYQTDLFRQFLHQSDIRDLYRWHLLRGQTIVPFDSPKPMQLTILTEVAWGTLGDYYAALTMIRLLQQKNPLLTVQWIMRGKAEEIPHDLQTNPMTEVIQFAEWSSLPSVALLGRVVFIFPTFHFLKDKDLAYLVSRQKIIFSCLEYSFEDRDNHPLLLNELHTGLADDEMGIFIRDMPKHPLSAISREQPIYTHLFQKHEISRGTQKYSLSLEIPPEQYAEKCLLFFGYANKDLSNVVNDNINVRNFIRICLALGLKDKREMIHIVVPLNPANLLDSIDWQGYDVAGYVNKQGEKLLHVRSYQHSPVKKTVVIIDLFRFDHLTFQRLMAGSHPFKLCTGDQSFSEMVSCVAAIPYYQVMNWKSELADHYSSVAHEVIEQEYAGMYVEQSPALRYIELMVEDSIPLLGPLIELLQDKKLLTEFILIHQHIILHKNLNESLPRFMLNYLNHIDYVENDLGLVGVPQSQSRSKRPRAEEKAVVQTAANDAEIKPQQQKKVKLELFRFFKPEKTLEEQPEVGNKKIGSRLLK